MQHHIDSLKNFVSRSKCDPNILAILTTGSVALGTERYDSDVDLLLVLTSEAFYRHCQEGRISYVENVGITYTGGYFDVKVIDLPLLERATETGDEPMKAYLCEAIVEWDRDGSVTSVLEMMSEYSDDTWSYRMASHIACMRIHGGYFLEQAVHSENVHLRHHAAQHAVFFGGRALLALNRKIFKGPKYLEVILSSLEQMPPGYLTAAKEFLRQPSMPAAERYLELVEEFHDWPLKNGETLSRFVLDNEFSWYTGAPQPENF